MFEIENYSIDYGFQFITKVEETEHNLYFVMFYLISKNKTKKVYTVMLLYFSPYEKRLMTNITTR